MSLAKTYNYTHFISSFVCNFIMKKNDTEVLFLLVFLLFFLSSCNQREELHLYLYPIYIFVNWKIINAEDVVMTQPYFLLWNYLIIWIAVAFLFLTSFMRKDFVFSSKIYWKSSKEIIGLSWKLSITKVEYLANLNIFWP